MCHFIFQMKMQTSKKMEIDAKYIDHVSNPLMLLEKSHTVAMVWRADLIQKQF